MTEQFKVVPVVPDRHISRAIRTIVKSSAFRNTDEEVYDVWEFLLDSAPDKGMVAVRRDDLDKVMNPDSHSFNEVCEARKRVFEALK